MSERRCAHCPNPIPAGKRPNAKFCSARCRRDHHESSEECLRRKAGYEGRTARCPECGQYARPGKLCGECAAALRRLDRWAVIYGGWQAGLDRGELADELGTTGITVSTEIARMRARGIELDVRRPDNYERLATLHGAAAA